MRGGCIGTLNAVLSVFIILSKMKSLTLSVQLTFTMEAIAAIARKAGTREAAQCVCAMGEHVARPLFAFVLI